LKTGGTIAKSFIINGMTDDQTGTSQIALFKSRAIRRILHKKEWWFSILDIVSVLTDSPQSKTYWAKMKDRDTEISQPFPFWEQLKMTAEDGKMRETDCADTGGSSIDPFAKGRAFQALVGKGWL